MSIPSEDGAMIVDVLISYSHQDVEIAREIHKQLEYKGKIVERDEVFLEHGRVFSVDIVAKLRQATHVLVLWSAHSKNSNWVKDEAAFACCHAKMAPLILYSVEPPEPFNHINSLSVSDPKAEIDKMTLKRINQLLNNVVQMPFDGIGNT